MQTMNNKTDLERFKKFVDSFKTSFEINKSITNYSNFTGTSKATISRCLENKQKINKVHFTIMRLVDDRNVLKKEIRDLKKIIKQNKEKDEK